MLTNILRGCLAEKRERQQRHKSHGAPGGRKHLHQAAEADAVEIMAKESQRDCQDGPFLGEANALPATIAHLSSTVILRRRNHMCLVKPDNTPCSVQKCGCALYSVTRRRWRDPRDQLNITRGTYWLTQSIANLNAIRLALSSKKRNGVINDWMTAKYGVQETKGRNRRNRPSVGCIGVGEVW